MEKRQEKRPREQSLERSEMRKVKVNIGEVEFLIPRELRTKHVEVQLSFIMKVNEEQGFWWTEVVAEGDVAVIEHGEKTEGGKRLKEMMEGLNPELRQKVAEDKAAEEAARTGARISSSAESTPKSIPPKTPEWMLAELEEQKEMRICSPPGTPEEDSEEDKSCKDEKACNEMYGAGGCSARKSRDEKKGAEIQGESRIPGTPGTPERQKDENKENEAPEIQGDSSRTIQTISFCLSWGCVVCAWVAWRWFVDALGVSGW